MRNCVFCKIVKRQRPAHVIYENAAVMAFLSKDPISDGHALVIPKKDIRDIHTLDRVTGAQIMEVVKMLADKIKKTFGFDGIMIMEVNGPFQDVPHFHMHVFGRNKKQDIHIKYPKGPKRNKMHMAANLAKLQKFI